MAVRPKNGDHGIAVDLGNQSGTVLASAARSASANSDDISVPAGSKLAVFLDITAVTGTSPTLDLTVKVKDPVSGKYFTVGTFSQKTATGTDAVFIGGGADVEFVTDKFRVEYTIGGTATPTFTFSLGYAVAVG